MRKVILIVLLFILSLTNCKSQSWRLLRWETGISIGTSNLFGEVGRINNENKYLQDIKLRDIRPSFDIHLHYLIRNNYTLKWISGYTFVERDDAMVQNNRNIHIRSSLFDTHFSIEYFFINKERPLRSSAYYDRRGKNNNFATISASIYIGFGLSYFDTRGKASDGKWYKLQPLGTEGQGIEANTKIYSKITPIIPFGIGIRYIISHKFDLFYEISYFYSFSDYIDDVSGNYFDNDLIRERYGDIAADLADRRIVADGKIERGNPSNNDCYIKWRLGFIYKIKTSRRGIPLFLDKFSIGR